MVINDIRYIFIILCVNILLYLPRSDSFRRLRMFTPHSVLFRCVRQERICIRGSVRRLVRPSVRPYVRYAFLKFGVFGTLSNQTLFGMHWGRFICLSVPLCVLPYIRHVYHQSQYTQLRKDTVRTHLCPVGLVLSISLKRDQINDELRFVQLNKKNRIQKMGNLSLRRRVINHE